MTLRKLLTMTIIGALAWVSVSLADDTTKSWLFVTHAGGFDFDGSTITLNDVVPDLTAFTDRPNRVVQDLALDDFLGLWADGAANAFADDPPNAVLSIEGRMGEPVILELSNPVRTGSGLSFDASVLSGTLGTSGGPVSLVVDGLGQTIPL